MARNRRAVSGPFPAPDGRRAALAARACGEALLAGLVLGGRSGRLQHLGLAFTDLRDLALLSSFPQLLFLDLRHNQRLVSLAGVRVERLDVSGCRNVQLASAGKCSAIIARGVLK